MALTPPSNTDIATRQDVEHAQALLKADVEHVQALMKADVEHAQALMDARTGQAESPMQASVWKVVVGTGVALFLALAATMLAGFQFLS